MLKNNDAISETNWYLEGILENGKKWIIPINKFPFFIGRSSDNDLSLSSSEISRKHSEIIKFGKNMMLKDLGSTNGTFVNDKQIKDATSLINQDKVKFGSIEFKIKGKDEIRTGQFTTTIHAKENNGKTNLLDKFDLTDREKEVFHLLLEGKSTKIIAGQLNITEGTAKNYVLSILKKTDVHSRVELVAKFSKLLR